MKNLLDGNRIVENYIYPKDNGTTETPTFPIRISVVDGHIDNMEIDLSQTEKYKRV